MNKYLLAVILLMLAGCVNVDPQSGQTLPRRGQKHLFATVESRPEKLRDGMTKYDVLILLGSPAEKSSESDIWVYLPERPAVLVPSRALHLEFASQTRTDITGDFCIDVVTHTSINSI